ncbi:MAG TPA: extracellular solute-binding protein [Methylomirabilota bacterium]|nr:extracellular solute-binding protein [Methylomirabilota bacterium]
MDEHGATRPVTRRSILGTGLAAIGAGIAAAPRRAPAQAGRGKPFAGTTLNVSAWSGPYPKWLGDYVPEFEEKTGIKVNYETPAFPVYNQRADLELSTKGSAYDVLNLTFIYSSRWIGAGWFTPLNEFLSDPNKTAPDWEPGDFLAGAVAPLKDPKGNVYAFPWIADAYMAAAARYDLVEKAGLRMPETFDDIVKLLKAVHDKEGVKGFVNENHHGWTWIPYLQGFGGNVFRNPPEDLMPTLDTPEAVAAAEFYANLLRAYGPDGILSYTYDQALNSLQQGRANYITFNQAWLVQLGDPKKSKVAGTVNYSLMPAGPKGRFPGIASHGFGIPVGSKKKDAAWEFVKWSLSKDMMRRMLTEKGYGSITRRSIIAGPEFKQKMTINGRDVADLYLKTIDLAARGYMKYRTVHVYPQVDKQIDKAIELITSGQMSAREAMQKAQANSVADLKKAGVKL